MPVDRAGARRTTPNAMAPVCATLPTTGSNRPATAPMLWRRAENCKRQVLVTGTKETLSRHPRGLAGVIAPALRGACHSPAGGQSPRLAPGPAGDCLRCACMTGPCRTVAPDPAGKRRAFPVPALSSVLRDARSLWQGPSPLPQRCAGIRIGRGPKPPASARPAPGGRFSPAGSGAGLRCSCTCRSAGHRRARAGETQCVS
jgi:hypothetical protein